MSAPTRDDTWDTPRPSTPDELLADAKAADARRRERDALESDLADVADGIEDWGTMILSTVVHLDASPGNGTRYRLRVVLQSATPGQWRIDTIAWPDVGWSAGDLGTHVSAEWLASSAARGRPRGRPAFGLADAKEIARLVNDAVKAAP